MNRIQRWASRALGIKAFGSSHELYQHLIGKMSGSEELGVEVNADTAYRVASVYACVRVVSEDCAKLPLAVYKRGTGGNRTEDEGHFLSRLFFRPNPLQTGFEFREMIQSHLELTGNFYALKTMVGAEVRELIPIAPNRITLAVDRTRTRIQYTMNWPDGVSTAIPEGRLLHVRGLSLDGIVGVSPIQVQRESIATAIQLTRYGARLYKNNAMIGGVLEHPRELGDEAAARLKASFDEQYSGAGNAGKTLLLEEGMKFTKTGMSALDASYIESRKFSQTEIASIYRIPPHMIGNLERATFSNVEQQALEYVSNGLMPRLTRLEKRLALSLLPPEQWDTYFVEHSVQALLRGDYATRMTGYNAAVMTGWMNRNEVRRLENMNPGPKELDEYLVPTNLLPAGQKPAPTTPPADGRNAPAPNAGMRALMVEAVQQPVLEAIQRTAATAGERGNIHVEMPEVVIHPPTEEV